ncbi:MAG: Hpt domain-containing protein, partial [Microcystaceae cyanobacterium]
QFFIEEAPELLQTIEDGLLTLRAERTQGKVHEMMRAAHSLKGGAASVELPVIKEISHRLEDIFKAFYNESVVIDEDMESLLLQAYDCLKDPLLTQIRDGGFDEETALNQANPVFEAIEFLLGDNLAAGDQFIPSSADLGVDIVSSLFEVDIVQGLEQIKMALESQQAELVQETLTTQTEVFAGLAEILNLSGFKAITEAVQTAIQLHPDQMLQVAQLAVQDWQGSCDQVLKHGDRQQGGTPSPELLALSGWVEESRTNGNGLSPGEALPDLGNIFGEMPVIEEGDLFALNEIPASLENDVFRLGAIPAPLEGDIFALHAMPESLSTDAFNLDVIPEPLSADAFNLGEIPAPIPPVSPSPVSLIPAQPESVDIYEPSYQFFIEEAPELLHMIEQGLLTLRTERTQGKVHEIMRAAHSLKGGAASVGLLAIKEISHRLEDIFKAFYNDSLVLDENLETLLLEAYDCLRNPLEDQINTGYY